MDHLVFYPFLLFLPCHDQYSSSKTSMVIPGLSLGMIRLNLFTSEVIYRESFQYSLKTRTQAISTSA